MVSEDSNLQGREAEGHERYASWLLMGAVAGVSTVIGGLATAWFYRKTLTRLRHAEDMEVENSKFRAAEDMEDEI